MNITTLINLCRARADGALAVKVVITDSVAVIIAAVSLLYAIYSISYLGSITVGLINLLAAIIYSFALLLSLKGFHRIASIWLMSFFIIHVFILSKYVFSPNVGFHYYLLTIPTSVFLLFSKREHLEKLLFTIIAAAFFMYFKHYENPSPYIAITPYEEELFFSIIIITAISGIFVVMALFLATISDHEAELEELATKDALTGINNRRTFMVVGEELIEQSKRYKSPLSLLLFDIDFFKRINDDYGHLAGDQTLNHVAKLLQQNLRASDCLARFGGEEFVVLLPETGVNYARDVAETLSREIRTSKFITDKGDTIRCTLSAGISQTSSSTTTLLQLVDQADTALYQAKNQGRDKSIIFNPRLPAPHTSIDSDRPFIDQHQTQPLT